MFTAIATLVLGLLTTLGAAAPPSSQTTGAIGGFTCPSNAKPANLNFTLKDLNGNDVRLAAYNGQVILLDFWATW
jgi:cytochrome oxidase Cu insertion factor (SCO1/SenC/PrrC family)